MRCRFLFLGTGGSLGIPVVSCQCVVCTSKSPLNKRLRPSGLLTVGTKQFVIDVGPDFRIQALQFGIEKIDGVLLTHTHYDHIAGIDELRVFNLLQKRPMPCLSSKDSFEEIHQRFHYLFRKKEGDKCHVIDFHLLDKDFGRVSFQDVDFQIVSYFQAGMKVTGYRVGPFAYISDIHKYEERVVEDLQGVEILVLSALRHTTSEVHFNFQQAADFSKRIGAHSTFFTHIAHEIDHEETSATLPSGIRLAHDGMEIEFDL